MRNRRMVALIVAATAVFGAGWLRAQPRGERTTVTGEVVDMWCYLEGGDRGAAKKACATACAKAGNPIAIDKMNEQVTATGTLVKKGGTQMLYIESVR